MSGHARLKQALSELAEGITATGKRALSLAQVAERLQKLADAAEWQQLAELSAKERREFAWAEEYMAKSRTLELKLDAAEQQIATLTQQIEACVGNDVAANPSEWSHSAQIDGLCSHLEDARGQVATLTQQLADVVSAKQFYKVEKQRDDALTELTEMRRFWQAARSEVTALRAKVATLTEALREANARLNGWDWSKERIDTALAGCELAEQVRTDAAANGNASWPGNVAETIRRLRDAALAAVRGDTNIVDPNSPKGQQLIRNAAYLQPTTQGDPPPEEPKCVGAHTWSNQFGDDWTPDIGTPCDCGGKKWGVAAVRWEPQCAHEFDAGGLSENIIITPRCKYCGAVRGER